MIKLTIKAYVTLTNVYDVNIQTSIFKPMFWLTCLDVIYRRKLQTLMQISLLIVIHSSLSLRPTDARPK